MKRQWLLMALAMLCTLLLNTMPAIGWGGIAPITEQLELPLSAEGELLRPELGQAKVYLDGYGIFRVATVNTIEAEKRAQEISNRLQRYVTQQGADIEPTVPLWRFDTDTNQPIVYLADSFIMTVTPADAALGGVDGVTVRADEIVDILETALARYRSERQPGALRRRLRWSAILVLLMGLLGGGLYLLHRWLSQLPADLGDKDAMVDTMLVRYRITRRQARRIYEIKNWLFWLGELLIWGGGTLLLLGLFPQTRVWRPLLIELLRRPLLIAIAVCGAYAVIRLGDILIDRLFLALYGQALPANARTQRASLRFTTFSQVLEGVFVGVVIAVCGLVILTIIGIDLGPLLASAGIVGLAISLASQSLIRDIINGFLIVMEDHYGIGDVVIVGEVSGFVETMNLRITQLRNEEGRLITIPNGKIDIVQNLSKEWSRVDLKIPVSLENDIDEALALIKQVAETMDQDAEWSKIILEPPLLLGVDNIDYIGATVRLWIKTLPLRQWDVAREYRRRLKVAFEAADLDFGVPQQAVHFVDPSVAVSRLGNGSSQQPHPEDESKPLKGH